MSRPDPTTDLFETHRPRLARLAYRMLGSTSEADDIVQEAWLRWRRVNATEVRTPAAFLTRIVTRLCLDTLKSARLRRETYVGAWLPEPVIDPPQDAPDDDDLTLTLMMALERLSPLERAAFLLHDVFGVAFEEVGATLDRDAAAARQLAARARRHVRNARPRYPLARDEGDRIAQAFFTASRSGDTGALRSLLAETVVLRADGGGKVSAWLNPIVGIERVLRLFQCLHRKFEPAEHIRYLWIDGLPGYATLERGAVLQTTALSIEAGRVTGVFITRNPDKLGRVAAALGMAGP